MFANDNSTSSIIDNEKRKETRRVASHERLSEVLKILRQMLEKYPMLQSNEIVGSAEHLIQQVIESKYFALLIMILYLLYQDCNVLLKLMQIYFSGQKF